MSFLTDHPWLLFATSLFMMWFWARVGATFLRRRGKLNEELRDDFGVILAASLTLLGLIIGFSFSMAISRYDPRKNYEEAEANAIGTEYSRVDFLPAPDAARVRSLLKDYAAHASFSDEFRPSAAGPCADALRDGKTRRRMTRSTVLYLVIIQYTIKYSLTST